MKGFVANVSMLFTEVPLLDRFERAARAGFDAVEVQFPYEAPAAALRERLQASGLGMVLHNLPGGDASAGERGLAALPGRTAEFRAGVAKAIEYANALGVKQLNALAGIPPAGSDLAEVQRTLVDNLRYAAGELQREGIRLLVEPINRFDVPGFWLDTISKGIAVIEQAACDNLYLQFDVYHAQRSEGDLAAALQRHLARIAHIQFADNPGRHEPGTGEIRFDFLFGHLRRIGYAGWLSAEYRPAGGTEEGLGWLEAARKAFA